MEKLAILGGSPTKTSPFPEWPQYDDSERQALMDVLDSNIWWRTPGSYAKGFEEEFAAYHHAKYGIACTNGTAALEIVIAALGIGLGDEVIVPDSTFYATASAVLMNGAMPVMVDVEPKTYCIDPVKVEEAITKRTKAIIIVHLAGHPADMNILCDIAKRHQLVVIEDCAHAHGSEWEGKKVGTLGIAGTFSFQQSKLMTAGEGGIIITNNEELEIKMRSVHDGGRMPGEWFYSHFIPGSNYRLTEWQGAILSQQLKRLKIQAPIRKKNAGYLNQKLAEIEGITPQFLDPRATQHGQYCYIFTYNPLAFSNLSTNDFILALNAEGIPSQASYPPVHALAIFKNEEYRKRLSPDQAAEPHNFLKADFPISELVYQNTVWLVHRTLLGDEKDTSEIVEAVKKIQRNANQLVK